MGIPPSTAPRLLRRDNRIARLRLAQAVRRAGLLRSSRAPCDFASQSSSLRSSGDLTASPQVHPALTRPGACGAGASRDGHSLRLHSPAADPSRVHLFDRFSRDRQCRAGGSHIIPDRTRKAQDTAIRPLLSLRILRNLVFIHSPRLYALGKYHPVSIARDAYEHPPAGGIGESA